MTESVIPKFGVGDKVRVVNYGHLITRFKKRGIVIVYENVDIHPDIIGKEGIIDEVSITHGVPAYKIQGISQKRGLYYENQLKMINKNLNR